MLDDTETGASLKKTKTGGNTAIGQVDHRVVDQISHNSKHGYDGGYLVKPGANRRVTE
jgi:hypothetical protein